MRISTTARALDAAILDVVSRGTETPLSEVEFNALARELCTQQWCGNAALAHIWAGLGLGDPEKVKGYRDIPPIPHGAFKHAWLGEALEEDAEAIYHTSGTSGGGLGRHGMDSLTVYRAASLMSFQAHVLRGPEALPLEALMPSPQDAPHSSLSAMMGFVGEDLCEGNARFWVRDSEFDDRGLLRTLGAYCDTDRPVLLVGTAFAFVHLCERMDARSEGLRLPAGSRVMETGGFKGRSRIVTRAELHQLIRQRLGVGSSDVVNEFGMTELSSQLYARGGGEDLRWEAPPWMRVRALDPVSRLDVPSGEVGVLAFIDLANRGSSIAVLTSDLGRVDPDGRVEILGRAGGTSPRGCSLALDMLLGASPPARPPQVPPEMAWQVVQRVDSLQAARGRHLANRPLNAIAEDLGEVSRRWCIPDDPHRVEALSFLPSELGIARSVLAAGLDRSFSQWSTSALKDLLANELPEGASALSDASEVTWVVSAGNLPTPLAWDVMCTLLVRSAVLVKPSSRCPTFARIFQRSLAAVSPELASCVDIATWPGGSVVLEDVAMDAVGTVLVNGSDDTVRALRSRVPEGTRFVGRGTRLSLGYVGRERLTRDALSKWLPRALEDVALWDQRGCLSPIAWVVESGGEVSPEEFAAAFSRGLEGLEQEWPRGRMDMDSEVALMARWDDYRVRAALSDEVLCWPNVVLERADFGPVGLTGRCVRVLPLSDSDRVDDLLRGWSGLLSTVVVIGDSTTHKRVGEWARAMGASRTCPAGDAQSPLASWRHDGMDVLRSLFS